MKKNKYIFFIILLLVGCSKAPRQVVPPCHHKHPIPKSQRVCVSFDSFPMIGTWEGTLEFAKQNNIKFTYFISAPYFITKYDVNYHPAGFPKNFTYLAWGNWSNYVIKRIASVDYALRNGHEIGSHAVGHLDGDKWTYAEWRNELKSFATIIDGAIPMYHLEKSNYMFGMKYIKGFRAPRLMHNDNMYRALKDAGYKYDASMVGSHGTWLVQSNMPVFCLPMVPYAGDPKFQILAMDYNFYEHQSGAVSNTNQELQAQFEELVFQTYVNHFDSVYNGDRHPLIYGNHLEPWNQQIYLKALKRYILYMKKFDVRFMTFSELMKEI